LIHLELGVQGLVLAWAFFRLACTLVYDHPGARTDFVLGFRYRDGHIRHNLGFYEMLHTLLVLWPATLLTIRCCARVGMSMAVIMLLYCPFRFLTEFLRSWDSTYAEPRLAGLTPAQYVCALIFVGAILLIIRLQRQPMEEPRS